MSSFRHGANHNALSHFREKAAFKMATRIYRETHYIEQTQKVIPFMFRETSFEKNVSELFFQLFLFGFYVLD